jgi:hypothetical protein
LIQVFYGLPHRMAIHSTHRKSCASIPYNMVNIFMK